MNWSGLCWWWFSCLARLDASILEGVEGWNLLLYLSALPSGAVRRSARGSVA